MIESLELRQYGRFHNRRFDFSPVTLFVGPNESGKSTIFDAIAEGLCVPAKTTNFGKRLDRRYGGERSFTLAPDGLHGALSQDALFNLLAINANEVTISVSERSSWMDRVKSELFSGGVDPKRVKRLLDAQADTHGNRTHMKERAQRERELDALTERRDELIAERDAVRRRQREGHAVDAELSQVESSISNADRRLQEIDEELAQQKRIYELDRLRALWRESAAASEIEEELQNLSRIAADEGSELEELTSKSQVERERSERAGIEADHAQQELTRRRSALHDAERSLEEIESRSATAAELRERLRGLEPVELKRVVSWRPWMLLLSVTALLAAGASLLFLAGVPGIIGATAGAVLSVVFILLSRSTRQERDTQKADEAVSQVRREWQQRTGSAPNAQDAAALREELYGVELEHDRRKSHLQQRREEVREAESRYDQAQHSANQAVVAAQQAERTVTDWLRERGVQRMEEYWRLRERVAYLKRRNAEVHEATKEALAELGVRTRPELQRELTRRIADVEESITREAKSDAEVRGLEQERERLSRERSSLQQRKEGLIHRAGDASGTFRSSMGTLPEQIAQTDRDIARVRAQIAELDTTRRAAAWAASMFEEVAEDSTTMLADLAEQIGLQYGSLVGADRGAELSEIDPMAGSVQDSTGTLRSVEGLSQGTRDAFVLASRLVLAERAQPAVGILIFDEAFGSLDRDRRRRTLALLEEFRSRTDWQLIFFTMDENLAATITERFPYAQRHDLSVTPAGAGGDTQ
jgi:DNA repair exonuclease SbcCD ATPase subunit